MPRFKAPEVAVQRLSLYLRTLKGIPDDRVLSSQKFAELVGTTDNQIRKDLSYFGWFGIRGQGYRVDRLKEEITHILTLNRKWRLALVGVGKLGSALLMYPGFRKDKFQIKLAFDSDPEKIGRTIGGIVIQDVEKIPELLPLNKIKVGIIATPADVAQDVADKLIRGKVKGILNFAPTHLVVPGKIKLKNIDLSIPLEILSFFISQEKIAVS